MPQKMVKQLKAIRKELETLRENANEDDFIDNFHYYDFCHGVDGAIVKIGLIMCDATI